MSAYTPWLLAAGLMNALAALLHLGCIIGGPPFYRFFGAGERLARLAERGSIQPALITFGIASLLGIWSLYAFSGAGIIRPLPLLRPALLLITAIYLLRAAALPFLLRMMPDRSPAFLVWNSIVVLIFGFVHLTGVILGWSALQ